MKNSAEIIIAAIHTVLYNFLDHLCAVSMSLESNVTKAVCGL